ncbi:MAG TPA: IS200/IS605 family element transposase accessory protein TnpB [Synechococcus sp. M44_DOE_062]|nr:IS200/IS605 family element transposase accessory protein TnpB [Synechococcus sp. M44_DOE_062]
MQARYRYRFYPTDQQKQALAKTFGCTRYVWNEALAHCQAVGKYVGYNALSKRLTGLKQSLEWLKEVSSVALQQSLRQLDQAYRRFFEKKGGFPQFKKKQSKQSDAFSVEGKCVYLAKIGNIKPIWSRALPSQPSSVTVIKDCAGRYFVSFVVEVSPSKLPAQSPSIGVDLGVKTFATTSDGAQYHSPNSGPLYRRITQLQKQLARRVKGSKRWERTRLRIAKLHARIADRRLDFLHKLSTKLTCENQVVCLEDLNVSGMLKNRKLSKAISRQGWGMFRSLCEAKGDKHGREVRVINRWEATSQYCSQCGWHWGKLDLATRVVVCDGCGAVHDRDENASRNVEQVGMGRRPTLKRTWRLCKPGLSAAVDEASRIPCLVATQRCRD